MCTWVGIYAQIRIYAHMCTWVIYVHTGLGTCLHVCLYVHSGLGLGSGYTCARYQMGIREDVEPPYVSNMVLGNILYFPVI